MTEDARNSLTALWVVSVVFGGGYLSLQLLKDVEFPPWWDSAQLALFVLGGAHLAVTFLRWLIRRRRHSRSTE